MTEPCQRRAWLTLGTRSVDLEDYAGGWFCESLDLGYPDVRDVTNNNPGYNGITDRTSLFGGRTVEAQLTAVAGAGATIDAVAAAMAPFMDPAARPQLHYILDRPGHPERVINGLRAAAYGWPVVGPYQRDIQLQWIASDPIIRDPNTRTVSAWAGSSTSPGRTYNLTFNRIYPPGGGSSTTGNILTPGDVAARPLYRVYGPITRPYVIVQIPTVAPYSFSIRFSAAFTIPAGQWVDVDSVNKTAYLNSDPTQSAATSIDWYLTTWPVIPPGVNCTLLLTGTSTSGVTQCQAIWQDGYLT